MIGIGDVEGQLRARLKQLAPTLDFEREELMAARNIAYDKANDMLKGIIEHTAEFLIGQHAKLVKLRDRS